MLKNGIHFEVQPLDYLLKNGLEALTLECWQEIQIEKEFLPFDPDWQRYKRLEQADTLRWVAAWQGDELVGYAVLSVMPHLHSKKQINAVIQDIFITKSARKGMNGVTFIGEVLDLAKKVGAGRIMIAERLHYAHEKGGLGKVLKWLGFVSRETIWTKGFANG